LHRSLHNHSDARIRTTTTRPESFQFALAAGAVDFYVMTRLIPRLART
jgi:hypothetical protein